MQLEMHSQDSTCAPILKWAYKRDYYANIFKRACKPDLRRLIVCGFAIAGSASVAFASDIYSSKDLDTDPNSLETLKALDAQTLPRGWIVPFPKYEDSLLKNYDGWRSTLAQYGMGFVSYNVSIAGINMLNTPIGVPYTAPYKPCPPHSISGSCQGHHEYFGEQGEIFDYNSMYLTFDLSRIGIPNGQFYVQSIAAKSTMQGYQPDALALTGLAYSQTLFDKQLEIKLGYMANTAEWAGTYVGGNFANTFGQSASVLVEMGLSSSNVGLPSFKTVWHITDQLYNQTLVQRSLPTHGPTGNGLYDETQNNPTDIRFFSSIPGTGVLLIDEVGYKQPATPDKMSTWLRFGAMANTGVYSDFSQWKTNPAATRTGNNGMYFLIDREFWKFDPTGNQARGFYAGASAMYANPDLTPFAEYFEGRLYAIGALDFRPSDMMSLVYGHNELSHSLADRTNFSSNISGLYGNYYTNALTATYLAHVKSGIWTSIAVAYTDNPSATYFKGEGASFNFLWSLVTNW